MAAQIMLALTNWAPLPYKPPTFWANTLVISGIWVQRLEIAANRANQGITGPKLDQIEID
jgi:hypothetical protein